jgi:hypothetical protein
MGEAKRRAREIADLKRTPAGEPVTPWSTSPVLTVFDQTWMILNSEFQAAVDRAWARPVTAEAAPGTIKELARLALWAERSGVKETVAQNWFAYQQRCLWDRAQQLRAPPSPLPTAPVRVLARSKRE